jgi:hypothetical protein
MAKLTEYGDTYEIADEGSYTATIVRFVDLGTQQTKYGASRMANVCFELADVTQSDGKPMLAFLTIFNFSARSKKLREFVRTVTGLHDVKDVEIKTLVGAPCMVGITHKTTEEGITFAEVTVKRPKPGAKKPKVKTDLVFFSLHPDEFSESDLSKVPERQQERIRGSQTYRDLQMDKGAAPKPKAADIISDDFPKNLGGKPAAADSFDYSDVPF